MSKERAGRFVPGLALVEIRGPVSAHRRAACGCAVTRTAKRPCPFRSHVGQVGRAGSTQVCGPGHDCRITLASAFMRSTPSTSQSDWKKGPQPQSASCAGVSRPPRVCPMLPSAATAIENGEVPPSLKGPTSSPGSRFRSVSDPATAMRHRAMLRTLPAAKKWLQRQERKRGKRKSLSILESKLGRTVYEMWRQQKPFEPKRFLGG